MGAYSDAVRALSGRTGVGTIYGLPKTPEPDPFEITAPGDPNFEDSAYGSQSQFPAAAAQQRLFANRRRAGNLINQLNDLGMQDEVSQDLVDAAATGNIERQPTFFERILGMLDAPRRTVNLAIQDVANGNTSSAGVSDYLGTLLGIKDPEEVFDRIGLNPESGSLTLSMLGIEEQEDTWGKWKRFGAHVALEILTDPLTYVTFGGSAVGKKALSQVAKGFVDDTMEAVAKGTVRNNIGERMLRRVDELEAQYLKLGKISSEGSPDTLKLIKDIRPDAVARERALAKATEELAEEVMVPVVTRDFGKLSADVTESIDAMARGGARLYLPLMGRMGRRTDEAGNVIRKGLGGIQKGIMIPGSQGLGRNINNAAKGVFDFVLGKGASTNFSQKTLDFVRAVRNNASDPWINLYEGMKHGRITGSEYYHLLAAANEQVLKQSVAETIGVTNALHKSLINTALTEGVITDEAIINRFVWRFIGEPGSQKITEELVAHGAPKLAAAIQEYSIHVQDTWRALAEGMGALDPRVNRLLERLPAFMPEVLTPEGKRLITKIAQSGANTAEITKAAMEANDPGGFFLASIIEAMGAKPFIGGNMTSHAGILGLAGDKATTVPMVNLVEATNIDGLDLAGRVILVDSEALSNVPWIAEMQRVLKATTPDVQISAPQLNDLIENHITKIAEELGIPLPKQGGARLFLEDPFQAVVEVTNHLHNSAKQLNIMNTARDIHLIEPKESFASVTKTGENIYNRVDPDRLEKAIADKLVEMERNTVGKAKAKAVSKYRQWRTKPVQNLDEPRIRSRWGLDDERVAREGYHGFIYDAKNDVFHWIPASSGVHTEGVAKMLIDFARRGQLEKLMTNKKITGSWSRLLEGLPNMSKWERTNLAKRLELVRHTFLGRTAKGANYVKLTNYPYADEVFNDMLRMLKEGDPDFTRQWYEFEHILFDIDREVYGSSSKEFKLREMLSELAHDYNFKLDTEDFEPLTKHSWNQQLSEVEEMRSLESLNVLEVFEELTRKSGLSVRGEMNGAARLPFGAGMPADGSEAAHALAFRPGDYISIQNGAEHLSRKQFDQLEDELEAWGRAHGNVSQIEIMPQLHIKDKPTMRNIQPPASENVQLGGVKKVRAEMNARLEALGTMPPGVARDAEYAALERILGKDIFDTLFETVSELHQINDHAIQLKNTFMRMWEELPTRQGREGAIEFSGSMIMDAGLEAEMIEAAKIAEEFGLDKKIINAFIPQRAGAGPKHNFVNPGIFGIAESQLKDQQVQRDVAMWFQQLVRNMGSAYTPLGIAQASHTSKWLLKIWKTNTTITRPTFHIRNVVGGVWNNQIIGVGMADYLRVNKGGVVIRQKLRHGATLAEALDSISNPKTRQMFWAAWDSGLLDQSFSRSEFRGLTSAQRRTWADNFRLFNPGDPDKFVLAQGGAVMMESIEDMLRLAAFSRWYDPAVSNAQNIAKEMSLAVHFDYSQLTEFETKIKNIVPFYVWFRRNIPLQMKTMMEQPGLINRYTHLMNAVGEEFDGTTNEYDQYATSEWWTAQAVGTSVVFNEGTPFWARVFFDPDLPVTDLTNLDPASPQAMLKSVTDLLGPHITLPMDIMQQADYGDVNAPAGLNQILRELGGLGFFNTSTDGDVRVPYLVRSMFNTAVPWWNEVVETTLGPSDPKQQLRLGDAEGETNLFQRVGLRLGRGVGLQLQTPADSRTAARNTSEKLTNIINEMKMTGILPRPAEQTEEKKRYVGLFSGG